MGQDKALMAEKPGEVMGYLAYGHPFLDGNGRTILTAHVVLAERAGISIDWGATDKAAYLTALTRELDHPGKGRLDAYLKPLVGSTLGRARLSGHIGRTPGLGGNPKQPQSGNVVLGTFSEPALQERYRQNLEQRGEKTIRASAETAALDPAADRKTPGRPPRDRGGRGR